MRISLLAAVAGAICLSLFSMPANAQASRTWISGVGDDANPCSRTAPCKTFAGAISKTAAGGEIDVLDPGGFGAVTITKGITFDGGGGQVASILVAGTNAINVSAGANDVVILRNLRINGFTSGLNGISFNTGGALIVEKCDIFDFQNSGINFVASTNSKLSVSDTHFTNVAVNIGTAGVLIQPTANVAATISRSYFEGLQNGVFANGGASGIVHVNVTESILTGMGNTGVRIAAAATSVAGEVFSSQISNAVVAGVSTSGGNASLKLGLNAITHNVTGVSNGGGTLQSYKNNMISDNTTDGTPITAVAGYAGGTGQ